MKLTGYRLNAINYRSRRSNNRIKLYLSLAVTFDTRVGCVQISDRQ